jgi:Autophagy-related protein 27
VHVEHRVQILAPASHDIYDRRVSQERPYLPSCTGTCCTVSTMLRRCGDPATACGCLGPSYRSAQPLQQPSFRVINVVQPGQGIRRKDDIISQSSTHTPLNRVRSFHRVSSQLKCPGSSPFSGFLPATRVRVSHPQHPLMILRQTPSLWFLLFLFSTVSSKPDAECHISIGANMYDFHLLSGDHTVSRTRSLPPTNMTDTLRFNICKELSPLEGVDSSDQVRIPRCPQNSLADD